LRSGLAVTPFALAMAASAVIAGRLVPRIGRWLTVFGLTTTIVGLAVVALVVATTTGQATEWMVAGPLFLAGVGGGMVTSPNVTLTLQGVPVSMAGAAGGALQTAQRIGSAIGTAVLATVYYQVLTGTGQNHSAAASDALLAACAFMTLALLLAVVELARRSRRQQRPTPGESPDEHLLHG
jgi:MFS family permease